MTRFGVVTLAVLVAQLASSIELDPPEVCGEDGCPGFHKKASFMLQVGAQRGLQQGQEGGESLAGAGNLEFAASQMANAGRRGADVDHGLRAADGMVSALKSLTAVRVAGGGDSPHLSGVDTAQLERVRDIVKEQIMANLQKLHAEDQAEVKADHDALLHCDTTRQAALDSTVAGALSALTTARASHKDCRGAESAAATNNRTAWDNYKALEQSIPAPPACQQYAPSISHMAQFFDSEQNAMKKWYEDNSPKFASMQTAFKSAGQALETQRAQCDGLQRAMEQDYCFYREELRVACSAYASCHGESLAKYQATVARVKQSEDTREALYKSGMAVVCHLDVVLDTSASKTHDACTDLVQDANTSHLTVSYPSATSQSACEASRVSASPCDADWVAAEFGSWMPGNVAAAACSRCPADVVPTPAPTQAPTPAPLPFDPVSGHAAAYSVDFSDGFVPQIGPADLFKDPDTRLIVDDPTGLPRKVLVITPSVNAYLKKEYFQFGAGDFAIQMEQRRDRNSGNAVTFQMKGPGWYYDFYNDYACVEGFGCPNSDCCDWSQWHTHKIVRKGGQIIQYIDGVERNRFGNNPSRTFDAEWVRFAGAHGLYTGHIANFMVFTAAPTPAPPLAPIPRHDPVSGNDAAIVVDFSSGFTPQVGPADLFVQPDASLIVDDPEGLQRKVLIISPSKLVRLKEEYFQFGTEDFAIQMDQRRDHNRGNGVTFQMKGSSHYDFYNDYACISAFGCPRSTCCDWSTWHTHKIVRKGGQIIQYIDGTEQNRFGNKPSERFNPTEVMFSGQWGSFSGHITNFIVFKK